MQGMRLGHLWRGSKTDESINVLIILYFPPRNSKSKLKIVTFSGFILHIFKKILFGCKIKSLRCKRQTMTHCNHQLFDRKSPSYLILVYIPHKEERKFPQHILTPETAISIGRERTGPVAVEHGKALCSYAHSRATMGAESLKVWINKFVRHILQQPFNRHPTV